LVGRAARAHPSGRMDGIYLKRAGDGLPDHGPRIAFLLGAMYWIVGAALVAVLYGYAGVVIVKLPLWRTL